MTSILGINDYQPRNLEAARSTDLLPDQIRVTATNFMTLLTEYYKFMNLNEWATTPLTTSTTTIDSNGLLSTVVVTTPTSTALSGRSGSGPSNILYSILSQVDVDLVDQDYLSHIQNAVAPYVPVPSYMSAGLALTTGGSAAPFYYNLSDEERAFLRAQLYRKIIKYFYNTRGSRNSAATFFQLFYNDTASIYDATDYPANVEGYIRDWLTGSGMLISVTSVSGGSAVLNQTPIQAWTPFSYIITTGVVGGEDIFDIPYRALVHPVGFKYYVQPTALGNSGIGDVAPSRMVNARYDYQNALWFLDTTPLVEYGNYTIGDAYGSYVEANQNLFGYTYADWSNIGAGVRYNLTNMLGLPSSTSSASISTMFATASNITTQYSGTVTPVYQTWNLNGTLQAGLYYPSIPTWFNNKSSFDEGYYSLTYLGGVWKCTLTDGFFAACAAVADTYNTSSSIGYLQITGRDTSTISTLATQSSYEIAHRGEAISFYHPGGAIGVSILDSAFGDNYPGTTTGSSYGYALPTYRLDARDRAIVNVPNLPSHVRIGSIVSGANISSISTASVYVSKIDTSNNIVTLQQANGATFSGFVYDGSSISSSTASLVFASAYNYLTTPITSTSFDSIYSGKGIRNMTSSSAIAYNTTIISKDIVNLTVPAVTISSASTQLTNLFPNPTIIPGLFVSASGIPLNTYVVSTSIITGSATVIKSDVATNSSNLITFRQPNPGVLVGMSVSGTGIASGTIVSAISVSTLVIVADSQTAGETPCNEIKFPTASNPAYASVVPGLFISDSLGIVKIGAQVVSVADSGGYRSIELASSPVDYRVTPNWYSGNTTVTFSKFVVVLSSATTGTVSGNVIFSSIQKETVVLSTAATSSVSTASVTFYGGVIYLSGTSSSYGTSLTDIIEIDA